METLQQEVKKFLKNCITPGTQEYNDHIDSSGSKILELLVDVFKRERVTLKKKQTGFDFTEHINDYLEKFFKEYKRTDNFNNPAGHFLNRFVWPAAWTWNVYTKYPLTRKHLSSVNEEELSNEPSHFSDAKRGNIPDDTRISLRINYDRYKKNKNPIDAVESLIIAHEAKLYPPHWVCEFMASVFKEYLESRGTKDLDVLFGFRKGKGRGRKRTAFEEDRRRSRNVTIAGSVFRLIYHGYDIHEACEALAQKYNLSHLTVIDIYNAYKFYPEDIIDKAKEGTLSAHEKDILNAFEEDKTKFLSKFPKNSLSKKIISKK